MIESFIYYLYILSYIFMSLVVYFYISPRKGLQPKHIIRTCIGYATLLSWSLFLPKETSISIFSFLLFILLIINTITILLSCFNILLAIILSFFLIKYFFQGLKNLELQEQQHIKESTQLYRAA